VLSVLRAAIRAPTLKVLFMAGYSRNAIVHQGQLDRGVELSQKPVTQDQLDARIGSLLDLGCYEDNPVFVRRANAYLQAFRRKEKLRIRIIRALRHRSRSIALAHDRSGRPLQSSVADAVRLVPVSPPLGRRDGGTALATPRVSAKNSCRRQPTLPPGQCIYHPINGLVIIRTYFLSLRNSRLP
jgi:hypothetical protein